MFHPSSQFTKVVLLVALSILFQSRLHSQDAIDILHHTAAAYRNLQTYEFHLTIQTTNGKVVSEQTMTVSGSRPAKFRMDDADPQGQLLISDGANEWTFDRASNEFQQSALAPETPTPISELETIDQHVREARIAREELFVADGKPIPVLVVHVTRDRWPADSPQSAQFAMYRIDKKTFQVYKSIIYSENSTQIRLYSILNWNHPADATTFTFTPPTSAHSVSKLSAHALPTHSIIGTEAPDFTLADTHGQNFHLHNLRGKVVIIDFWATWCGPCRQSMPELQRLYRENSGQGLVVLGLNIGEEAPEVNKFAAQQSFTFPLLLGAEPDVAAEYFVEGYPTTFVIDRQGKIVFRGSGGDPPDHLRSAVSAALRP